MRNEMLKSCEAMTIIYTKYQPSVYRFILYRIGNEENAKDLTQDVFFRLMDYEGEVSEDTMLCFIYTIAANLVKDYLRRCYKKQEVQSYLSGLAEPYANNTESRIMQHELLWLEKQGLSQLPPQQQAVYILSRFVGKSSKEISLKMNLSHRTVEGHLLIGRKKVRAYMKSNF